MASDVIKGLNDLLADAMVFRFKAQQRHWNIKGRHFFELHAKFEEQYNRWSELIDELAERVLSLGGTPLQTFKDVMTHAAISEAPGEADEKSMVKGTLDDFETMRKRLAQVSRAAAEVGDRTTENLLDPHIDFIAKARWMFAAFLGESV
ncbi:MAG: DNA starvation/stationary phase protection protein [Phycisphaerales bacterium]|nr:DNA starvation/stationary phase protection protein [Phycisphaerales bacterium]